MHVYFMYVVIIQYPCFCDWLISFSIMSSRIIYVVICVRNFFKDWIFHYIQIYILCILVAITGHLVCFYFFNTVKNATMNFGVQLSVWVLGSSFFAHIPRRGIAASSGTTMFSFLRNWYIIFIRMYKNSSISVSSWTLVTFQSWDYLKPRPNT